HWASCTRVGQPEPKAVFGSDQTKLRELMQGSFELRRKEAISFLQHAYEFGATSVRCSSLTEQQQRDWMRRSLRVASRHARHSVAAGLLGEDEARAIRTAAFKEFPQLRVALRTARR